MVAETGSRMDEDAERALARDVRDRNGMAPGAGVASTSTLAATTGSDERGRVQEIDFPFPRIFADNAPTAVQITQWLSPADVPIAL